jgi:hypothetical protein
MQSPDVCENNSEIEIENGWVLVFRNISCNSHMGCRFAPTHNSAVVRGECVVASLQHICEVDT